MSHRSHVCFTPRLERLRSASRDAFLTTDAGTLERLAPLAERIRLAEGQAITLNLRTRRSYNSA
jgi:hypothetical protein